MAEQRAELGPLPAGHHKISAEEVAQNQRARLLAALVDVVGESGYTAVTVSRLTAAAHVSRRTFYEQFDDREACFLAAFDDGVKQMGQAIDDAIEGTEGWPERVVAGLSALLDFLVAEPQLAKLLFVDSLTAGSKVAEHYRETVVGFTSHLVPGRAEHRGEDLPDSTDDTVIGGVASVINREILAGRGAGLGSFREDFTAFVLAPYLGAQRAKEIAAEAVRGA